MLRAAAAFLGCFVLWVLVAQRVNAPLDFVFAAVAVVGAVLVGGHFGGGVSASFLRAPYLLLLELSRVKTVLGGALSTARAALAGDVRLTPGLARLKTRGIDADARADVATIISTTPGNVVVEADGEGLLIHLINEHEMDGADLSGLEARALAAHGVKV
ncbi:MAG: Na+/H+ antiporter subunit E [Terricaulis sp.]